MGERVLSGIILDLWQIDEKNSLCCIEEKTWQCSFSHWLIIFESISHNVMTAKQVDKIAPCHYCWVYTWRWGDKFIDTSHSEGHDRCPQVTGVSYTSIHLHTCDSRLKNIPHHLIYIHCIGLINLLFILIPMYTLLQSSFKSVLYISIFINLTGATIHPLVIISYIATDWSFMLPFFVWH